MCKVKYMFGILAILMATSNSAQEANYVTVGTAYNLDNNQVIFRETYSALNSMGEVQVSYLNPQGKQFATKTLVFQGEPYQPTFVFEDSRDDETLSVQFERGILVMQHKDINGLRQESIMDNAGMVIDSGLDSYVQLHWDQLLKGKALKFDYALPRRLSSTKMSIEKMIATASPLFNQQFADTWIYFKLEPARKWKALFADPIYLAYDTNGKYLMRFQGRSNIDDAHGIPQDVRIEYEYF